MYHEILIAKAKTDNWRENFYLCLFGKSSKIIEMGIISEN